MPRFRKMTMRKLASDVAKVEGKKSQARVGDIREILSILSDMYFNDFQTIQWCLWSNGAKRAKRKRK